MSNNGSVLVYVRLRCNEWLIWSVSPLARDGVSVCVSFFVFAAPRWPAFAGFSGWQESSWLNLALPLLSIIIRAAEWTGSSSPKMSMPLFQRTRVCAVWQCQDINITVPISTLKQTVTLLTIYLHQRPYHWIYLIRFHLNYTVKYLLYISYPSFLSNIFTIMYNFGLRRWHYRTSCFSWFEENK